MDGAEKRLNCKVSAREINEQLGRRRERGRVVSYLGRVVAGSGEGCQVRRVAARVETRERSSEIPSRDIGHSLTRPPTALAES